jgi:hypothetical protein
VNVLPDVELLAVTAVRLNPAWQALDAGVFTEIPASPAYPLITIIRIGGAPVIRGWHDRARLQLDAYAEDKHTARLVAATAQAALHAAEATSIPDHGVIGAVSTVTGPRWLPDPTTRQARYVLDMTVDAHPHR